MKSYIRAIETATPVNRFSQMQIGSFMAEASSMKEEEKQRLMVLYKATGIQYRYSVLEDFGLKKEEYRFFPKNESDQLPTVSDRLALYQKEAVVLSLEAARKCLQGIDKNSITHVITVSCTGMQAPGLDLELTEALDLRKDVMRTCINFMGCYAAFNALKVADAFCKADPSAVVLIVSVELCTIHYQNSKNWDDIVANSLFGDGAAAVIVQGEKPQGVSMSLESFYCTVAFSGKKEMAWSITDKGFEMLLSNYVPDLIQSGIKNLTDHLLDKAEIVLNDIETVAIHPGGRKILEVIENELNLDKEKTKYSHEVLREFGNMSSATILFVLKKVWEGVSSEVGSSSILSFAFGPGLTMESMILKLHTVKEFPFSESKEPEYYFFK